jgi:hypothetical protein
MKSAKRFRVIALRELHKVEHKRIWFWRDNVLASWPPTPADWLTTVSQASPAS